jgi:hypothetical protein
MTMRRIDVDMLTVAEFLPPEDGHFGVRAQDIAEDLGWPSDRVLKALRLLCDRGQAVRVHLPTAPKLAYALNRGVYTHLLEKGLLP